MADVPEPVQQQPPAAATTEVEKTGESKSAKKRKFVLFFGYVGEEYYGLQYNHDPKHPTIEQKVMEALHKAKFISDDNMEGKTQVKIQWQRASRTDKGVHALRNVISVKLPYPEDSFEQAIGRINAELPDDIRLYQMMPVTGSFNSKLFCHARRYEYYLPTLALMKPDVFNEWLPTSVAPEDPGADDIVAEDDGAQFQAVGGDDDDDGGDEGGDEDETNGNGKRGRGGKKGKQQPKKGKDEPAIINAPLGTRVPNPDDGRYLFRSIDDEIMAKLATFRLPEKQLEQVRMLFKQYEGTIPFHNFTPRGRAQDKSTIRFIRSVTVSDPFVARCEPGSDPRHAAMGGSYDLEWVRIELVGQSFMLNQIRKMIGCISGMMASGLADAEDGGLSFMQECLSTKVQRGIPMAPANGLFLVNLDFTRYNQRLARIKDMGDHGIQDRQPIDLDAQLEGNEDAAYIRRGVVACVMRRETRENITGRWMRGMRYILKMAWGLTRENRTPILFGPGWTRPDGVEDNELQKKLRDRMINDYPKPAGQQQQEQQPEAEKAKDADAEDEQPVQRKRSE